MKPHKVHLSPKLQEISDVIGFAATLKLAHEFGGTEVDIPKNPKTGTRLVECIGQVAAEAMKKEYGPGKIAVPVGPASTYNQLIRGNARVIHQGLDEGLSNAKIARQVGCDIRTVRRHKNAGKENCDDQGKLF
ncbi:helix-turn-helix domain-containing protein [Emcibacter sp.]|uniref:helix-turn-helix domain-containing protein n=1 Tax=Emcibacter sp. TaxID=1979954 RepID=UPI002AA75155|nr:helix-turn-helix domain-containing protein [Emcibacter sp.]